MKNSPTTEEAIFTPPTTNMMVMKLSAPMKENEVIYIPNKPVGEMSQQNVPHSTVSNTSNNMRKKVAHPKQSVWKHTEKMNMITAT